MSTLTPDEELTIVRAIMARRELIRTEFAPFGLRFEWLEPPTPYRVLVAFDGSSPRVNSRYAQGTFRVFALVAGNDFLPRTHWTDISPRLGDAYLNGWFLPTVRTVVDVVAICVQKYAPQRGAPACEPEL